VLNHTLLLQDKKDGMRAVVRVMNRRNVMITNRRGVAISVRSDIVNELIALAEQLECDRLEFDCELMGWGLYIFDILAMKECVRHQSHALRLSYLGSLDRHLAGFMTLKVAKTTIVTKDNDILEHCIEANRLRGEEGLIIRLADAHYEKGRPNSFGSVLKLKHVQDITCVVIGASANKRSVELGLYDHQGQLCEVGKVTIPANENVPTTGALVDVRYLWVIGEGGKLIQPVFNGVRTDYEAKECHVDKLVYRDEAIMLNVAEA
jgi:bifunctional non-homologous end joining protein LigD